MYRAMSNVLPTHTWHKWDHAVMMSHVCGSFGLCFCQSVCLSICLFGCRSVCRLGVCLPILSACTVPNTVFLPVSGLYGIIYIYIYMSVHSDDDGEDNRNLNE